MAYCAAREAKAKLQSDREELKWASAAVFWLSSRGFNRTVRN